MVRNIVFTKPSIKERHARICRDGTDFWEEAQVIRKVYCQGVFVSHAEGNQRYVRPEWPHTSLGMTCSYLIK